MGTGSPNVICGHTAQGTNSDKHKRVRLAPCRSVQGIFVPSGQQMRGNVSGRENMGGIHRPAAAQHARSNMPASYYPQEFLHFYQHCARSSRARCFANMDVQQMSQTGNCNEAVGACEIRLSVRIDGGEGENGVQPTYRKWRQSSAKMVR